MGAVRRPGLGWAVGRARKSSFAPAAAHGSEGKPDSSRGGIIDCGGASSAGAITSTGVSTGASAISARVDAGASKVVKWICGG